jgi:hypothetical protein
MSGERNYVFARLPRKRIANVAGRGNRIMSAEARLEDPAGELV